jgi:UTP--glucose-1-phosphate uridylyltransferase
MTLAEQIDRLPPEVARLLEEYRFDRRRFLSLAERLTSRIPTDNRVKGAVTAPAPRDVTALPEPGSDDYQRLEQVGLEALSAGHVALVVLAGGMATRMGGVVKALVDALPGRSFLDLRLTEVAAIAKRAGRPAPLWLMTSNATDADLRAALDGLLDGKLVAAFPQHLSIRLTPEGDLFRDGAGNFSVHAPGHGDLPGALKESGLLGSFVAAGGQLVMVANIDNLGATVEPAVVGWHLDHGAPVSCEVVEKVGSDRGGIPVRLDNRPVVLEEFRLPKGFDPATVRVFNTNTFMFDAKALNELEMDWTFFTVTKKVDDRPAVQFERLVGEVTSHLETKFLKVPRSGVGSRFLPVKDPAELQTRQPEIEAVAKARGMLS